MKVKVLFIFVVTYFVLLQISCDLPSGSSGNDETGIAKAYWGEWSIVQSSEPLSLYGDKISISEYEIRIIKGGVLAYIMPLEGMNLYKRDDICPRMIQLDHSTWSHDKSKASSEYFLLPIPIQKDDISTVSFTGRVVRPNSSSQSVMNRAVTGIGGIQVIIDNLNDNDSSPVTVETDSDGNFLTEGATPGDTYEISTEYPDDGDDMETVTIDFTPIVDGDDMGNITITDGINFKVNRNSNNVYYFDEDTNISLSIKNVGSTTAQGATCTITTEGGLMLNPSGYSILGTIAPDEEKKLSATIKCNSFSGSDLIWKKIFIEVNDPISKKTWNDSVSIPFRTRPLPVPYIDIGLGIVDNDMSLRHTVIAPNGEIFNYRGYGWTNYLNGGYEAVSVPKMPGEYTLIVFNGYEKEGMYVVSNRDDDDSKYKLLPTIPTGDEIAKYKPNHTAADAPKVTLPVVAYSLRNHMDFYKISLE